MKAVRVFCGYTPIQKEFSIIFRKKKKKENQQRGNELGPSHSHVPDVPGAVLQQDLLPARNVGKEATQAGGRRRTLQAQISLDVSTLKKIREEKCNHCNSGEKWCSNSCQVSYPPQVFLCPFYLTEGRRDSSRCSGPPRPCKKSWPSRRWDAGHGQAVRQWKAPPDHFPKHRSSTNLSLGWLFVKMPCLTQRRVLWKLQFPSCIITCTNQSMKYKVIYLKV